MAFDFSVNVVFNPPTPTNKAKEIEMSEPIEIKATVATWLGSYHKPHELVAAMKKGDAVRVASMLTFWGEPDQATFGSYVRVGEADVTIRLVPHDEQVRMAVQALQQQLEEDRMKWLQRQQQILEQIQNLQAITYEAEAVEA